MAALDLVPLIAAFDDAGHGRLVLGVRRHGLPGRGRGEVCRGWDGSARDANAGKQASCGDEGQEMRYYWTRESVPGCI